MLDLLMILLFMVFSYILGFRTARYKLETESLWQACDKDGIKWVYAEKPTRQKDFWIGGDKLLHLSIATQYITNTTWESDPVRILLLVKKENRS